MDSLQQITEWTGWVAGLLWGNPLTLAILLGTGLYLTIRMGLVQLRGFSHAIGLVSGKYSCRTDAGEVSHFQALSTALSATVGTGNIAGVATAITLGGPGALFWMWVTAVFGMATKFVECTLALQFRTISPEGEVAGGPMYTLLHGLKMPRLAALFAAFALIASFGIGNMVQANSVMDGLRYIAPELNDYRWFIGCVLAALVGLVILGGVKRIARVASTIVPFMAMAYLFAALLVLFNHAAAIPAAVATIFNMALNPWSVGGAVVGEAIRWGVARGLFSNEAGLGSSPMAHAAARTNEPVREGLVAMLEPFIDTLVICTLTGLVIVVTGAWQESSESLTGAALTAHAFNGALGDAGSWVVGGGLTLFAYSTMIAWSYYGDRSAYFLFGEQAVLPYRVIFTVLVVIGAAVPLQLVWNIADVTNILMALPNLIGLVLLAGLVKKLKDDYFATSPTKGDLS
jgi:AGCS family alanine or glycine:cation symporter